MLFAFPAAIAVPIIAGFLLGGPILGFSFAVLAAAVITAVAIRMEPRGWRRIARRAEASAALEPAHGAPYDDRDRGWRRAAARRALVPFVIAVAGIVVIVAGEGTTRIIGWGVLAIAITLAISLMFLEIGYSEDRARARRSSNTP